MSHIREDWYDDPAGSGKLRYWDGIAWTEHLRDTAPVSTPALSLDFPPPTSSAPSARVNPYASPGPTGFLPQPGPYGVGAVSGKRVAGRPAGLMLLAFGIVVAGIALAISAPANFLGSTFDEFSSAGPGAVEAPGHVTSLNSTGADCMPSASFEIDGVTHTALSPVTFSPCNTAVGRAVTVSYLESDIDGSAIVVFENPVADTVAGASGIATAVFVIAGLLVAALGLWVVIKNPTVTQTTS